MTTPPTNEAHLLVMFGEVRGDVKSLLRSQQELTHRIGITEEHNEARFIKLEGRLKSLEAIRLKVAGFTMALAMMLTLTRHKIAPLFDSVFALLGG